jgi:hypothetical protein
MSDKPLSEQFRLIAKQWVEAESAANLLEDTKSAVLARMMAEYGDIPVNRAETNVKSSDEWLDHVTKIIKSREKALLLKVQLEYIRMKFNEWQSAEATRRAEMKL